MSNRNAMRVAAILTVSGFCLAGCAGIPAPGPRAEAKLEARSGSSVSGTVRFSQAGDRLRVEASVSGLAPGAHGFHIHDSGDCSAPDATSAEGHFNPGGKAHGHHEGAERHAGAGAARPLGHGILLHAVSHRIKLLPQSPVAWHGLQSICFDA